jgi:hypothetical protein
MLTPKLADEVCELVLNAMWAVVRSSTPITEPPSSFLFIPRQPLVADPTTDTVPSTQLRHRESIAECIANEPYSLFHR